MKLARAFVLLCATLYFPTLRAEKITIAAAADLKFALADILTEFRTLHPGDEVEAVYGSSGKFHTQIQQGAPYDLYFSADIDYPRSLARDGLAASDVRPYARGRIVLWSSTLDVGQWTLADLANAKITRIAIANPKHAPYGKRAEEALRASGIWSAVEPRLVFGESVAHTAQFVESGSAQVGIIALSLALSPSLAARGRYAMIPENLHKPLEQGFIITRHGAGRPLARQMADYMASKTARAIMIRYGFLLPGETAGR